MTPEEQTRLQRDADYAADTGDPAAPLLRAALSINSVADRIEGIAGRLGGTQQLTDAQIKDIARRLLVMTDQLSKYRLMRLILVGAAVLVLVIAASVGATLWWRPGMVVAGISGGTPRCDPPRPDGSKLCWIPVFEVPPVAPQQQGQAQPSTQRAAR